MIKLTPRLEFDKYNLGFVIAFIREKEYLEAKND